jgi:calcium uniporter regulatory subunit MCUb, mitochondrial
MRESMHDHAKDSAREKLMLQDQLIQIKKQLEPLEHVKTEQMQLGQVSARRYVNSFAGIILFQYFLTQYGTYFAFSWDIIEPIACCLSMSDAAIAYAFWVKTGRPWDINGLREHFIQKKMQQAIKRKQFDEMKYNNLSQALEKTEQRLRSLN